MRLETRPIYRPHWPTARRRCRRQISSGATIHRRRRDRRPQAWPAGTGRRRSSARMPAVRGATSRRKRVRPALPLGLKTSEFPSTYRRTRRGEPRRGLFSQAREGGPRGLCGPSRMPTGVGCSAARSGTVADSANATGKKVRGESTGICAYATPRQHSWVSAACAGTDLDAWPALAAADLQNVYSAIGPPSRMSAAWATGWRTLSVIAKSAAASAIPRQPESGALRIMPNTRPYPEGGGVCLL
jgi:hypothetical protein